MSPKRKGTILWAVEELLRQVTQPLHYRQIAEQIVAKNLWESRGDTPWLSVNSQLHSDLRNKGQLSIFKRTGLGEFGLREWQQYPEFSLNLSEGFFRIEKIELLNYRCFEQSHFHFSDQVTLFIGENGAGKTSILDALAKLMGQIIYRLEPKVMGNRPAFDELDARITTANLASYPVGLRCYGQANQIQVEWGLEWIKETGGGYRTVEAGDELLDEVSRVDEQIRKQRPIGLPVFAYYGDARFWGLPQPVFNTQGIFDPRSRYLGYEKCLNALADANLFVQWFQAHELMVLQEGRPDPQLESVKNAIYGCLPHIRDIKFVLREGVVKATRDSGQELPYKALSDGERSILAMVADLAIRMTYLNSQMGDKVLQDTTGIVLIDEIDYHLHPNWQRRILNDLRRTFPRVQFVVTTHSPFVVQSLREGELNVLGTRPESYDYKGKSIDEISEEVMSVESAVKSQRQIKMRAVTEAYFQKLQQSEQAEPQELERLSQELDQMLDEYSDDEAFVTFLQMEKAFKFGGKDETH